MISRFDCGVCKKNGRQKIRGCEGRGKGIYINGIVYDRCPVKIYQECEEVLELFAIAQKTGICKLRQGELLDQPAKWLKCYLVLSDELNKIQLKDMEKK